MLWLLSAALADDAVPAPPVDDTEETEDPLDIDAFLEAAPPAAPAPPPRSPGPNTFNPRITAFGDALWSVGRDEGTTLPESAPWLRSFEQDGPTLGHAHEHDEHDEHDEADATGDVHGAFVVVPEEVYVDLVALPGGLSAPVGPFLLPFGITNRMHPHDWPWARPPLPFTEVIGEHGLSDAGLSTAWRRATGSGTTPKPQSPFWPGAPWIPTTSPRPRR